MGKSDQEQVSFQESDRHGELLAFEAVQVVGSFHRRVAQTLATGCLQSKVKGRVRCQDRNSRRGSGRDFVLARNDRGSRLALCCKT